MEPIATYREIRLEGRRTFRLFDDHVVVSVRSAARDLDLPYDLGNLCPNYLRMRIRPKVYGLGVGLLVLPWCLAALGILSKIVIPTGEFFVLPASFSILGFAITAVSFGKVEYAHFRTKAGVTAFEVAKAGKQADHFDEFVGLIVRRIHVIEEKDRLVRDELP